MTRFESSALPRAAIPVGRSVRSLAPTRPRRMLLAAAAAGALAASTLLAVLPTTTAAAPGAAAATAYKETNWDELVPKDWDPLKRFREMNLGAMSESSPRVLELMREMRETWDNAPTNFRMDGAEVKLPGYVVPLEEAKGGMKEFMLVPYFGACIHTPPPPANQIVHVVASKAVKGLRMMDAVWVSGTLKTARRDSVMGVSGYRMDAVEVVPYAPPAKP